MQNNHLEYYPPAQAETEAEFVRQRLQAGRDCAADSDDQETIQNSLGLALSGGGIRSATFNLGLLQSLASAGQLKDFDFLSTVSGGGYIGACLGRLYQRSADEHEQAGKGKPDAAQTASDVEQVLASDQAPLIRWLRDHGRYLAPQGLRDRLFALAIYLRNMLTVHVLLGLLLLLVFIFWELLRTELLQRLGMLPFWIENFRTLTDGSHSPAWLLLALSLSASLGCAWAYWMHRFSVSAGRQQRLLAMLLLAFSAFTLYTESSAGLRSGNGILSNLLWTCSLTAGFALLHSVWAKLVTARQKAARPVTRLNSEGSLERAEIRNQLSRSLAKSLQLLLALFLFALLDETVHQAFHWFLSKQELKASLLLGGGLTGALLAGLRSFAQAMAAQASRGRRSGGPRWIRPAINAIGVALLALLVFFWALTAVAYIAEVNSRPAGLTGWPSPRETLLWTLLVLGLLNWASIKHLDVLNLSSLHHFYAARLARAYLGAGNPKRGVTWSANPATSPDLKRVDEVVQGDDMQWPDYQPHIHGGPLHLVNVTVNQTQFSADSDFQPDRKGWNLAVGPAGFNLGRGVWKPLGWNHCEPTRLGTWIAASGAAFSTGAGARTGLGFSALLGLLGVRLGYWWRAGDSQQPRRNPNLLTALWGEVTGQFNPDQSNYWYLSDGGHFENCAAYELIRRRLKRIVVADCGADPQYGFEDLANLVLKARLDFAAEITLLSSEDLNGLWGNQADLRALFAAPSQMEDRSGPGLLLARVAYPDDPVPGWMVIVKPRLPAELPVDLANYALNETRFPQQSTLDQFYDESQWESMRKLGRLQGEQLASTLLALPGWKDLKDIPPIQITGAPWSLTAEECSSDMESSAASQLKYYAPIAVALWTGFEFYSSYQQQQNKQAAEVAQFALSRIDKIESMIGSEFECKKQDIACPQKEQKIAAHIGLVQEMVNMNPPPQAGELLKILEIQAQAANVARVTPKVEGLASTPFQPAPEQAPQRPDSDLNRALVYLQIYDETRRAEARAVAQRLQQQGLNSDQTPGIENVTRTALAKQRKVPDRFTTNTVVYFDEKDKPLADWIGSQIDTENKAMYRLLDLSKSYKDVRKGQVEVWLP